MRTTFPKENDGASESRTDSAQKTAESESESNVKFPKPCKHRGRTLATIYGKKKNYPYYRLAYRVNGQRRMRHFATYSEALAEANKVVKDLATGGPVWALTSSQGRDALAALGRLQDFYVTMGRRVSLLAGISEYCEAAGKLHGRTLGEAVQGYCSIVHPQLDDLERQPPLNRLELLGDEDGPKPAFPDPLENLVATDDGARTFLRREQHRRLAWRSGLRFRERSGAFIRREEVLQPGAKRLVCRAGVVEETVTLRPLGPSESLTEKDLFRLVSRFHRRTRPFRAPGSLAE